MDAELKAQLVKAVNLLISSPNAHAHFQTMLNVSPLMARHPELNLSGEAAALNPLARLKVSAPETYDNLLDLIERKRSDAGFDKLQDEQGDKFDRTAYMQQFMEQKRVRQRRAADIENTQRSERDKLIGRSRLDFMQRQSAVWKEARDALVRRAKISNGTTRLNREQMTELLLSFWSKVDEQLDALEAQAKQGKRATPTSLDDLNAALRHDPYRT